MEDFFCGRLRISHELWATSLWRDEEPLCLEAEDSSVVYSTPHDETKTSSSWKFEESS
jgi:hypothetical protein